LGFARKREGFPQHLAVADVVAQDQGQPGQPVGSRLIAQAGLGDEAAADWLARLTLILCNHIGDREVLREAFALARESQ